ncbi:DUF6391 domain-containing protein [Chloroflexota bacterium]
MSILDLPTISRIRRNHGLEHASLTILSKNKPGVRTAGISYPGGFLIAGDVDISEIQNSVQQALERMRNGEHQLAVHPNCGTNMTTSGILAGVAAWLGMTGAKDQRERRNRLPLVISLVTLSLIYSRPLGPIIQERITTSGNPEGLQVMEIIPFRLGNLCIHRVITTG